MLHRPVSVAWRIRFMVAGALIAAGFVIVPLVQSTRAQGLFDIFGGGGSGGGNIFGSPAPQSQSPAANEAAPEHRRHHAKHDKDRSKSSDRDEASGSGYTSVCVRTCDGYSFPVGAYRGDGDRPAHEATCRSECPEAQTALYIRPGSSDAIEDSVRADTKQSYSKLPAAFKFKTDYSEACSCHRIGGHARLSFMRDYTLRRGDVVMTKEGLKVFHGGSFPYKVSAFSPLLQSRDVARKDLPAFEAMNRARLRSSVGRELTVTRLPAQKRQP